MLPSELERALRLGESSNVEFKRCGGLPGGDVFESVCAFANRYGGDIYLGVHDDGTIAGIEAHRENEIKRNLVNVFNNPKLFDVAPTVEIESIETPRGTVIRLWVPISPYVLRYKGVVYDRVADVDVRISGAAPISAMYIRKQSYYSERKIFRYLKLSDLRGDLIERARKMAVLRSPGHPWREMDDVQLLRSARLYDTDYDTGAEGYTLAAALLFAPDDVIASVCPPYLTDVVVRREDLDRYDDRLIVRTNLLDAYDQIIDFICRQLPDRFHLEGMRSVSPRDIIVRELVANSLMHREFSSAIPARFVVENDGIHASNASRSMFEGAITLGNFSPISKNPLIAGVFQQIGFAEQLGSGMHNLYRYSRIYSGRDPVFTEGDVFRAFVPVDYVVGPAGGRANTPAARMGSSSENQSGANQGDRERVGGAPENMSSAAGVDFAAASPGDVPRAIEQDIESHGFATASSTASIAGVSSRTASRYLNAGVSAGNLRMEGSTRNRRYFSAK